MEFIKYKKIKQLGHLDNKDIFSDPEDIIDLEEKVDGANFRFMVSKEAYLIFGSRTQELVAEGDHIYQKQFNRCIQHVLAQTKCVNLSKLKHLIFYGENCIRHSIAYDWENIPPYLGFDVFDTKKGMFLDRNTKVELFKYLNLDVIHLIRTCKAKDIEKVTDKDVPASVYRLGGAQAEGVVFKNYTKQMYAKYVTDNFKEVNKKTFGGNPHFGGEMNDCTKFVHKYCTNPRIDKCIFKLVDEGNNLDMPLMKFLPRMVNKDIWEENWEYIYCSRMTLDFHKVNKLITKRCSAVLKQVITNNAFENERSAKDNK